MSEDKDIAGLQTGDAAAFRAVFDRYWPRMCHFAATMLPDAGDAEDVVQEAFVRLWEHRARFRQDDAVRAFLYTSIRNRCLNIWKHDKVVRKYGQMLGVPRERPDAISQIIEAEVLDRVHRALELLPAGCRHVLELSYFEGLRNQDIAARLKVSVNTVKTQKKRALHLLRGMIRQAPVWLLLLLR